MFYKQIELGMINNRKNIQHLRRWAVIYFSFYKYATLRESHTYKNLVGIICL